MRLLGETICAESFGVNLQISAPGVEVPNEIDEASKLLTEFAIEGGARDSR